MASAPTPPLDAKQRFIAEALAENYRRTGFLVLLLAAGCFVLLSGLDYLVAPAFFIEFMELRGVGVGACVASALLVRRARTAGVANALGVGSALLSVVLVELMILRLGGHRSGYVQGLDLVAIIALGFVPMPNLSAALFALSTYLIYLVPIVVSEPIVDVPAFVNNNAFLLITLAVTTAWRHVTNRNFLHQLGLRFDLEQARVRAEEASRLKGEFLANVSHEIRTPLSGIIGTTHLALGTELSDEQRDYLETLDKSAAALLHVVNEVLDFSKIEAGELALDVREFVLPEAVEDAVELLAAQATQKGLELLCECDTAVTHALCGDVGRIRQVLVNLGGNAVKFTHQGHVRIRSERLAESDSHVTLRFSVHDTGIGVPVEQQEPIFAKFHQADGSTTRTFGGTGLGLAVSRALVEAMGGHMGVQSEVGRGSEFWFELRLAKAPGSASTPPTTLLAGRRLLLVDDNAAARASLAGTLRRMGCQVEEAASPTAALELVVRGLASDAPFALAVIDRYLPRADGDALARRIHDEASGIGIVLLTRLGDRLSSQALSAMGCHHAVPKPVRPTLLRSVLEDTLVGQPASSARSAPARTPARRFDDARVLLVEDNAVNQRVMAELLRRLGCSVVVAENGVQAVEIGQRDFCDLVFMDVQMPEMDGFEATRRLRALEQPGMRKPIIAMTAHAIKGDRERCLASGMDDYLTKPVLHEALVAMLERWLCDENHGRSPAPVAPEPAPSVRAAGASLASTPSATVVDMADALLRFQNDRALYREILGIFLENAPSHLEALRRSLASGDAAAVHKAAHGLKGAAGNVSAVQVYQLALAIERHGRAGQLGEVPVLLEQLGGALERLVPVEQQL